MSLVAQLVSNLTAVQETWVRSLGLEGPLEKGKALYIYIPSLLNLPPLENPMDRGAWQAIVHRVVQSRT